MEAFKKRLVAAIPAFLHIVESFDVPVALRKGRFGVKEYHHPDIVTLVNGANPDADVSDILAEWLGKEKSDFTGPAQVLWDKVDWTYEETLRRVCPSATKLGQVLRRLSRVDGWRGRITSHSIRYGGNRQKQTIWTLYRGDAPVTASASG